MPLLDITNRSKKTVSNILRKPDRYRNCVPSSFRRYTFRAYFYYKREKKGETKEKREKQDDETSTIFLQYALVFRASTSKLCSTNIRMNMRSMYITNDDIAISTIIYERENKKVKYKDFVILRCKWRKRRRRKSTRGESGWLIERTSERVNESGREKAWQGGMSKKKALVHFDDQCQVFKNFHRDSTVRWCECLLRVKHRASVSEWNSRESIVL